MPKGKLAKGDQMVCSSGLWSVPMGRGSKSKWSQALKCCWERQQQWCVFCQRDEWVARRCRVPSRTRTRSTACTSPTCSMTRPTPIWCPEGTDIASAIPALHPIFTQMVCGGRSSESERLAAQLPPLKIKARFEGRISTIDTNEGQTWYEVQKNLASKLHMAATDFVLYHDMQETLPAQQIPVANRYGHIHVDVCKIEQRPGRRPTARGRSRTPSRPAPSMASATAGVQTSVGVVDMESMYFPPQG